MGIKLAGQFVEISTFSEQGDRSRCLPKSRNLVVFCKVGTCQAGPIFE